MSDDLDKQYAERIARYRDRHSRPKPGEFIGQAVPEVDVLPHQQGLDEIHPRFHEEAKGRVLPTRVAMFVFPAQFQTKYKAGDQPGSDVPPRTIATIMEMLRTRRLRKKLDWIKNED